MAHLQQPGSILEPRIDLDEIEVRLKLLAGCVCVGMGMELSTRSHATDTRLTKYANGGGPLSTHDV